MVVYIYIYINVASIDPLLQIQCLVNLKNKKGITNVHN